VGLLLAPQPAVHFRVRAFRRRANQAPRPARPDPRNGEKGLVSLRVAPSPLQGASTTSKHIEMSRFCWPDARDPLGGSSQFKYYPVPPRPLKSKKIAGEGVPRCATPLPLRGALEIMPKPPKIF
jgi:hypothetical protein